MKTSTEGLMSAVLKAEKLGIRSKFLELAVDKRSHEELGLQVADVVAGDVRRFFRFNPDLLTAGSDLNLIMSEPQDGEEATLEEIEGRLYKKGRRVPIPPRLLARALKADENFSLPYLRNLVGAGLVRCLTEFGVERDVAIFDGCFLDLCD